MDQDICIVGAGLSGIGAGCHIARALPQKSFTILEGRDRLGGTWDLFRYPGARSDSDMYTLAYRFKPWTDTQAIVPQPRILAYLDETARQYDIERRISLRRKVIAADWSSSEAFWRMEVLNTDTGETEQRRARFLLLASGYYRYESGYTPDFPGLQSYAGRVVHPQAWTEDIQHAGKRVLIIGSGATAVTLAPALAESAASVTLLQRSPTYIYPRPSRDPLASSAFRNLPPGLAHRVVKWRNILQSSLIYRMSRRRPEALKKRFLAGARAFLGEDYDVATHFTPRYNPWDQRVCLAPDGDFYRSIRAGKVKIVTDEIETFTPNGVRLKSGSEIEADLIVTATGLVMQPFGGIKLSLDGASIDPAAMTIYRGYMYGGVPNFASIFGYLNASWTLRADIISEQVCHLIALMDRKGYTSCVPRLEPGMARAPWADFSSGYIQRAEGLWPAQGVKDPWRLNQNYLRDLFSARFRRIEDGVLQFA